MKRLTCILLSLIVCLLAVAPVLADTAGDTLAKYEKMIEGDWKLLWRYLPLDKSSFLSDKCKPANYWSYPDVRNKSGETVETHLMTDETGEVYLIHITSGDTHNIMSFEGGWVARLLTTDDANLVLAIGVDGTTCLFQRDSAPPQEKKKK